MCVLQITEPYVDTQECKEGASVIFVTFAGIWHSTYLPLAGVCVFIYFT